MRNILAALFLLTNRNGRQDPAGLHQLLEWPLASFRAVLLGAGPSPPSSQLASVLMHPQYST